MAKQIEFVWRMEMFNKTRMEGTKIGLSWESHTLLVFCFCQENAFTLGICVK